MGEGWEGNLDLEIKHLFGDFLRREDIKKMNNFTVNFTSAVSTNSVLQSSELLTNARHIVHSINFLFGLPTHTYVIWLIITGTGSEVASGFFNLNLSFCEIVNCLNSLFSALTYFPWLSSLTNVTHFLVGSAITGRPLFQCLVCVERYLAVVHPVTFLKFKPLRYRVICCTVAWIITLGSCLCCLFTLVFHFYIYRFINSFEFLLFFSIQMFCLVAVLRALKQSGPGQRGREREEENPMKKRALHVIIITTVSMAITYMPFTLSGFVYVLTLNADEPLSVSIICFILGGFIQPVLYLNRTRKFFCLCSP
ncbi:proteinase-activated receptor 3-like [Pimephales promelas]|uniref:proteinase-activated receptor 3-like n=1 Tax=Pimephales promelas TaxID=90988 RepID=UPI001955E4FF|nr:proteinase-activated receptor 3-like [Pimephales promelas]